MATYCVTYSEDDDWGVFDDRFSTKEKAKQKLDEVGSKGRFARIIKWANGESVEVERTENLPNRE